ncbi:hypothetical protein XM38_020840 [Halomicronema hongdechloris C2206]|uniref:N-acetyltransferase domain-containing protein n=1 Tax=Halomicronema hongdechloris C2206 TaxID=1641165 RepID=A0A1Z3HLF8_9CYAN|nr:GNAT family N-acetyltransferase [Halomicronema hongdechloris]ASC71134.1 hypothetical protein XM38_020840 [Halomicronema hongdechloris C2206]
MSSPVTTYYLEICNREDLIPEDCPDPRFWIGECTIPQFEYNRFLYHLVGRDWSWTDKYSWSDLDWKHYVEDANLRTWVGYYDGCPAGYFELQKQAHHTIEITYFGFTPAFVGKGLEGSLLTHAITSAWAWEGKRVWAHISSLDHPHALSNYQARGMTIYETDVAYPDGMDEA